MVQRLFVHAVETGLLDETIRSKIRPAAQNARVSDEDFLGAMGRVMVEEHKIGKKLARGKSREAAVLEDECAYTTRKEKAKEVKTQQDHVWAVLKSVQSQLESMQLQVSALQNTANIEKLKGETPRNGYKKSTFQPDASSSRGCPGCAKTGSYCNRSFLCSGINHFARNFHSRRNQYQGNDLWLPP